MGWLIAALAAPAAGPILYGSLHYRPRAAAWVDGFVYLAVPALVAWQILPEAWEQRSLALVAAVVLGLLAPGAIERLSHALHRHTDSVALAVGLSGLALHALLEGAALVPTASGVGVAFALAVILHRVPVGLIVWWLLRPRYGTGAAAAGVAMVSACTLLGWLLGVEVLGRMHEGGVGLYQAFVSGSLVHVVYHQGRGDHRH
ncbi:MAG TPA: hypothetical protein VFQ22_02610 [Longimicrobiales bacterium]|nr:hypothetical protein [Longimicrobiales bacterium]